MRKKIETQALAIGNNWTTQQITEICQDPLAIGKMLVNTTSIDLNIQELQRILQGIEEKNNVLQRINKNLEYVTGILNSTTIFGSDAPEIWDTESLMPLKGKSPERPSMQAYLATNFQYRLVVMVLLLMVILVICYWAK